MLRRVVVGLALWSGCSERPPGAPGESTSEDSTTTTTTGAGDPATASATSEEPAPTSGPYLPEGLFACLDNQSCSRWDCAGGCEQPGPEGMCALGALYDRATGVIEVARCDGPCALHRLIPRGAGTDEVRWQWRSQTKPPGYAEIVDCMLQPRDFFEACLIAFTPECADPAAWVKDCQPTGEVCFD
ncbi:hypothetical protein SAMN02745121_08089 [Nannocystis exedens]|uniref:Lipoprotein n=1 Tax=Nannocystis exedens TaxID=54 RepID=A0A1I2HNR2_9BACT|nr:hypothetical protein [Nannocystis exedens]PCC69368.1 hypothetical protein NAEX_02390 [Nannocystis exedens]SFF31332.1 hypothetical protein SAMN02745121_08089 [Nannocystis exedens]